MKRKSYKKHKLEKIYAFIDSQNLNLGVRNQGWKLDFNEFFIYLKDKHKVDMCYLFIGYIPKYKSLYKKLKSYGYSIVFKPTLDVRDKSTTKGNVDAELVLHTMLEVKNFDKAIIVSGDGDFYCLIKYLKSIRKLKGIILPNPHKYSALLREFSKNTTSINNWLRKKLENKSEGH